MSEFCYAPASVVVEGPRPLPQSWKDPLTGKTHLNFNALPTADLLALGWYPYVENDPGAPGLYYHRTLSAFTIHADHVSRDASYTQWDIEEVRGVKNSALLVTARVFTANELALSNVGQYVEDDQQWIAKKQAELARLTDWTAVSTFDTVKPLAFTLPNSVVGASYVKQGAALTAQNQAYTASGLAAPWDQTEINTFVAANQTAADDHTNATAAVKPGYKLRQGVAVAAEQFNRVVVWRFDVEGEVDPNLDRSIAMQITNRQDDRDIYVFIYTGAGTTYLGWKKLEDQGGGVWKWALDKTLGDGSIMPWVDSDIAFIMSYISNQLVPDEYFTDQIQFPSGQEETSFLVAWDPA